jgi:hypothetical protein
MPVAQPKGDPVSRAFAAYFREATWSPPQPSNSSGVVEHKGKQYVVLENVNGVLAVYRIRNNGYLKQLKRWPAALGEAR